MSNFPSTQLCFVYSLCSSSVIKFVNKRQKKKKSEIAENIKYKGLSNEIRLPDQKLTVLKRNSNY